MPRRAIQGAALGAAAGLGHGMLTDDGQSPMLGHYARSIGGGAVAGAAAGAAVGGFERPGVIQRQRAARQAKQLQSRQDVYRAATQGFNFNQSPAAAPAAAAQAAPARAARTRTPRKSDVPAAQAAQATQAAPRTSTSPAPAAPVNGKVNQPKTPKAAPASKEQAFDIPEEPGLNVRNMGTKAQRPVAKPTSAEALHAPRASNTTPANYTRARSVDLRAAKAQAAATATPRAAPQVFPMNASLNTPEATSKRRPVAPQATPQAQPATSALQQASYSFAPGVRASVGARGAMPLGVDPAYANILPVPGAASRPTVSHANRVVPLRRVSSGGDLASMVDHLNGREGVAHYKEGQEKAATIFAMRPPLQRGRRHG